ncbi:hypothetical protein [Rhodopirellula bahusiensis]|uniref:hypothetical protein n=1 Tax=Rhodopirellula bahusiensis TaxID=2014065 RepID=UPI00117A1F39|nr:hypothetical protein [Rhodopirellula bahusiensis]
MAVGTSCLFLVVLCQITYDYKPPADSVPILRVPNFAPQPRSAPRRVRNEESEPVPPNPMERLLESESKRLQQEYAAAKSTADRDRLKQQIRNHSKLREMHFQMNRKARRPAPLLELPKQLPPRRRKINPSIKLL